MKIDSKVEPLVREALDAAVKQDIDRLDAALDAFADDTKRRDGLALLFAISRLVLHDLNEGKNPTDEQVSDLADWIAEEEAWAGLPADEIRNFLLWLLGDDSKTVNQDMYIVLVFVVTATLLSSRRQPDGQWWFDYLDQIEAALEAAPNPS
jgi:hypothetical protein